MQRPGWVGVVGVLVIVLGCFGLLGAGQMAMMPSMMKMQREMLAQMQEQMPADQRHAMEPMQHMIDSFTRDVPPWYTSFAVAAGLVLLAIKGFYIFSGIALLQVRRSALAQFYWAAGLSIVAALVNGVVMVEAFSFMGMAMAFSSAAGIVFNLVLLAVVLTSDRSAFRDTPPPLQT